MFLLNLNAQSAFDGGAITFTFHYVSIKSMACMVLRDEFDLFTFHYVSIKSIQDDIVAEYYGLFTFHYVSIKSLYA